MTEAEKLGVAGLRANLGYWKNVALRYQQERDAAMEEVRLVRAELYKRTGRRLDGHDYLREIIMTKASWTTSQRFKHMFKHFIGRITNGF